MKFFAATLMVGAAVAHSIISSDEPTSTESWVSSEAPYTTSTIWATTVKTVTSCHSTVTNCPAHSTVVVTDTVAVSTTVCPVTEATSYPTTQKYYNSTSPGSYPPSSWVAPTSSACPTYSVKSHTSSYTSSVTSSYTTVITTVIPTVIPTVIYETVSIPCPTTTKPSAGYTPSANGTLTTSKPTSTVVHAGASAKAGSALLAVAAGLAAVVLA